VRLPICCLSLTRLLWLDRLNVLRIEGEEIFTILGELWQAVLAFAPEETDPRDGEPMIEVGRKVTVVGFVRKGRCKWCPWIRPTVRDITGLKQELEPLRDV